VIDGLKRKIIRLFRLETYEDLLVAVLRILIVKPYYFIKTPIRALRKISNGASKLKKLETYENAIAKTMKFFMHRNPIYFWFVLTSLISRFKSKKTSSPLKANTKFHFFNQKHPYLSTSSSILSYALILGTISFLAFTNFYSSASAWWNDDWLFRKQLTINSAEVTADLTNFPILVSFTDGDLASKAQADGDDIVFTLDQGNQLHHEIESFDNSTGALVAWVKIPELDSDQDSLLYMYYGNPTTDNQQKAEEVWDENFVMVQHLGEGSANSCAGGTNDACDSTRNDFDGTWVNEAVATTQGKVGNAITLDGSNDYVEISDNDDLDLTNSFTIEAWIYADDWGQNEQGRIVDHGGGAGPSDGWTFQISESYSVTEGLVLQMADSSGGFGTSSDNSVISTGSWLHVVGTLEANTESIFYVDGSESGTDTSTIRTVDPSTVPVRIGIRADDTDRDFDGWIDEVRISKIVRSPDWIQTEFNNQDDPASFLSVGYEERGNSPVLYLPLDEGFGTTAHDESSSHNDATITGATWATEDMCKTGACLQFDGNDYLEIDDDNTLDLSNEMTMEAWVKPTSTDKNSQTIISKQEQPDTPTRIFRSVGPSATTAITTGSSNEMTITGTTATFASALPTNVGVGDAIQYDDDNDGDIDADDSIAFISERTTSTEYKVQTSTGGVPTAVGNDTDWSLFRAYTSLSNAESGTENTGIDDDMEDFDTWTGGKDISSSTGSDEQWNFACYANGTTADGYVGINDWTTEENNFIRFFTPTEPNEVGVSQRHNGTWTDTAYKIVLSGQSSAMRIFDYNLKIDGFQIEATSSVNDGYDVWNAQNLEISNCIAKGFDRHAYRFYGNYSGTKMWNNLSYDNDYGMYANGTDDIFVYNNTFKDCDTIGIETEGGGVVAKNNIVQDCVNDFNGTFESGTSHNITDLSAQEGAFGATHSTGTTDGTTASKLVDSTATFATDGVQVGSIVEDTSNTQYSYVTALDSETQLSVNDDVFASGENYSVYTNIYGAVIFENEGSDDFRLDQTDTLAINQGTDLSADSNLAFNDDIESDARNFNDNWDIGADEYVPTRIYRSVGPGSTTALEEGTNNPMTIVGDTATFTDGLADNVGVGDAIQYDDDDDGDIDSSDSIVFIKERISNYQYKVQTAAGANPVVVEQDTDWSLFRAYTSLANAESGDENDGIDDDLEAFESWTDGKDLVTSGEQWNIACYADAADTTAVTIDGWTTGANNYIKVYTPVYTSEVGESQRHEGAWGSEKYMLQGSFANINVLSISAEYIKIDGLQIKNTSSNPNSSGLRMNVNFQTVSNSIVIVGNGSGDVSAALSFGGWGPSEWNYFYNSVFINYSSNSGGIAVTGSGSVPVTLYNCTMISNGGESVYFSRDYQVAINSLAYSESGTAFVNGGSWSSSCAYNASNDETAPGNNSKINQTFSFVDDANDDFHLSSTDTAAKDAGTDLSNDPNLPFTNDIDDDEREGSWSIGADEGTPTKIFRSVGFGNTTALVTGADNDLTINESTATFDEPLPDRIGVGDAIQYDDDGDGDIDANDSIVFISGRISASEFSVQSADGSAPTAVTDDNDWSIFRAYTSLFNAESGDENDGIDDDLEAFESWSDGKDLVTAGEQWNVACYGDATDATSTTIDGWTTSEDNYIKVYTPMDISEVGESQRHEGFWGSGYRSTGGFNVQDEHVRVDGVSIQSSSQSMYWGSVTNAADFRLSNSYLETYSTLSTRTVNMNTVAAGSELRIENNIFVRADATTGDSEALTVYDDDFEAYVYNNTFIGGWGFGFNAERGVFTIRNCLAYGSQSGDIEVGGSATALVEHCASEDGTADDFGGSGNRVNQTFSFVDSANNDFRLAMSDTAAKGAGVNLYNDTNIYVTDDIEGEARPETPTAFDIGADQISTIIHDNYSMSLFNDSAKITSSEETFATFEEDIPANRWTHIAYARDPQNQYLYIDGREEDASTIEGFLFDNNGKLYIGAQDDNSSNSFQGFLDEIRIYNYARSTSEIRKDRAAGSSGRAISRANEGVGVTFGGGIDNFMSDGLVAYYKMDETTGTTVTDHSGLGNTGTLTDAQETGTAETASTTTTIVDADNSDLSTTDDVYNGMTVEITGGSCGITAGTTRKTALTSRTKET